MAFNRIDLSNSAAVRAEDERIRIRFANEYDAHLAKIAAEEAAGALQERIERFDLSPILMRVGGWAITTYGIECLYDYYPIEGHRIHGEDDWVQHLGSKGSIAAHSLHDFTVCHDAFRHRNGAKMTLGKRFTVLKRDGYRCQICGASAADGARFEVDHQVPRAKGGSNHLTNLWTLCFDCNRGKSTTDL